MVKIAPSILSADFNKLGEEVKAVELGGGDMVHIDVMDGHFVPNITIGPAIVKGLRKNTELPFDVHLMLSEPDKYIEKFIKAGADIIVIHPEAGGHIHRSLNLIKENNVKVGVALNPATPVQSIEPIIGDLDMVVIMTVNPGFPAQKFIRSMSSKIEYANQLKKKMGLSYELEVDGGVNLETVTLAVQAGADILVAGNAVFHGPAPSLAENIRLLKDKANLANK